MTQFFMPMPGSEDAPRFGSSPSDFDAFFFDVEELSRRASLTIPDMIKWSRRYAAPESQSWQYVSCLKDGHFPPSFDDFKEEVLQLYPHLDRKRRYVIRDLEDLVDRTQRLVDMSREGFGLYTREFTTIAQFLVDHSRLSPRESSALYLKGFPHSIHNHILRRLAIRKPDLLPDDGYESSDIREAALFVIEAGSAFVEISSSPSNLPNSEPHNNSQLDDLLDMLRAMIASAQSQPTPPVSPPSLQIFQQPAPRLPTPGVVVQKSRGRSPPPPVQQQSTFFCIECTADDHLVYDCPFVDQYLEGSQAAEVNYYSLGSYGTGEPNPDFLETDFVEPIDDPPPSFDNSQLDRPTCPQSSQPLPNNDNEPFEEVQRIQAEIDRICDRYTLLLQGSQRERPNCVETTGRRVPPRQDSPSPLCSSYSGSRSQSSPPITSHVLNPLSVPNIFCPSRMRAELLHEMRRRPEPIVKSCLDEVDPADSYLVACINAMESCPSVCVEESEAPSAFNESDVSEVDDIVDSYLSGYFNNDPPPPANDIVRPEPIFSTAAPPSSLISAFSAGNNSSSHFDEVLPCFCLDLDPNIESALVSGVPSSSLETSSSAGSLSFDDILPFVRADFEFEHDVSSTAPASPSSAALPRVSLYQQNVLTSRDNTPNVDELTDPPSFSHFDNLPQLPHLDPDTKSVFLSEASSSSLATLSSVGSGFGSIVPSAGVDPPDSPAALSCPPDVALMFPGSCTSVQNSILDCCYEQAPSLVSSLYSDSDESIGDDDKAPLTSYDEPLRSPFVSPSGSDADLPREAIPVEEVDLENQSVRMPLGQNTNSEPGTRYLSSFHQRPSIVLQPDKDVSSVLQDPITPLEAEFFSEWPKSHELGPLSRFLIAPEIVDTTKISGGFSQRLSNSLECEAVDAIQVLPVCPPTSATHRLRIPNVCGEVSPAVIIVVNETCSTDLCLTPEPSRDNLLPCRVNEPLIIPRVLEVSGGARVLEPGPLRCPRSPSERVEESDKDSDRDSGPFTLDSELATNLFDCSISSRFTSDDPPDFCPNATLTHGTSLFPSASNPQNITRVPNVSSGPKFRVGAGPSPSCRFRDPEKFVQALDNVTHRGEAVADMANSLGFLLASELSYGTSLVPCASHRENATCDVEVLSRLLFREEAVTSEVDNVVDFLDLCLGSEFYRDSPSPLCIPCSQGPPLVSGVYGRLNTRAKATSGPLQYPQGSPVVASCSDDVKCRVWSTVEPNSRTPTRLDRVLNEDSTIALREPLVVSLKPDSVDSRLTCGSINLSLPRCPYLDECKPHSFATSSQLLHVFLDENTTIACTKPLVWFSEVNECPESSSLSRTTSTYTLEPGVVDFCFTGGVLDPSSPFHPDLDDVLDERTTTACSDVLLVSSELDRIDFGLIGRTSDLLSLSSDDLDDFELTSSFVGSPRPLLVALDEKSTISVRDRSSPSCNGLDESSPISSFHELIYLSLEFPRLRPIAYPSSNPEVKLEHVLDCGVSLTSTKRTISRMFVSTTECTQSDRPISNISKSIGPLEVSSCTPGPVSVDIKDQIPENMMRSCDSATSDVRLCYAFAPRRSSDPPRLARLVPISSRPTLVPCRSTVARQSFPLLCLVSHAYFIS